MRYWRNSGEETAGLHQNMSKDSDHTKVELAPGGETQGHNPPSSAEDPLVELARIVHRNKQPGGEPAGNRVETTNYFDGLDDLAGTPAEAPVRVEPQFQPVQPQPDPEPAPVPGNVADAPVPAAPQFEVANDPIAPEPQRWDEPEPVVAPQVQPAPAPAPEAVYSRLEQAVVQNLEENLSAELEDELIGAFKQSFTPAAEARAEPQIPAVDTPVRSPEPRPAPLDFRATPGPVDDDPRLDQIQVQPEPVAPPPPVASAFEAAPTAAGNPVAPGRSPISHEDLFSDLNALAGESAPAEPAAPAPQEPTGVEALFADLAFSPDRDRTSGASERPFAIDDEPETDSELSGSDDIDDMVWPDAVSAIPRADDEETPPPPEGYDLDAVAKAMQESDPTLDGSGVLPPHPQAEKKAAPGAERNSRKGLYAAGGVAAVALIGGLVFLFSDGSSVDISSGPPPIIAGLQGPLKVYPESETPPEDSSASKLIYDRVGTQNGQAGERMVIPEKTTPVKLPPAPTDTAGSDPLVPGAPKKVVTMRVRPDGTIVSDQPAAAPAPTRQVETTRIAPAVTTPAAQLDPAPQTPTAAAPAAPAVPAAPVATQPVIPEPVQSDTPAIVSTGTTSAGQPAATSAPVPSVVPRKKPAVPVQVARAPQAQAPARTTPAPARTQAPANTRSGPLDLNNPNAAAQPAATQPAAPRATAPAATGGRIAPGTYIVQVTSQRSESAARNAYRGLQQRYPGILGNREAVIVSANIEDRGTYYRARIPTGSRAEAISLCESLKGAGGDCFVRRN